MLICSVYESHSVDVLCFITKYTREYTQENNATLPSVAVKYTLYMWQSWMEIKYYSVTYFERITKFDAL